MVHLHDYDKEQKSGAKMKELSSAEKSKLNTYAKALIMTDNRKASAIGEYVKTILKRDILPPSSLMPEDNNCVLEHFRHKS